MTTTSANISPIAARRLAIMAQRLGGPPLPAGKAGLSEVFQTLRCVQLDPISVVARSHQLVLWSRLGRYDLRHLDSLLWQEHEIFEYWAHCASLVLTADLAIHWRRMQDYRSAEHAARHLAWLNDHAELREHVLQTLQQRGPLPPRAFEDRSETEYYSAGWTSGRTINQLLQTLWLQGYILVAGRKGTTRLWDLAERVLKPDAFQATATDEELDRQAVMHAVRALGIARTRDIRQHFIRGRYRDLAGTLAALEAEQEVQRVTVRDGEHHWPGPWYVPVGTPDLVSDDEVVGWQPRDTLLSPFDNLICDRARLQQLFGLDYTIEIYVPAAKRRYGYYAMPILLGDRLVGTVDPLFDRKTKRLMVQHLTLQPTIKTTKSQGRAIMRTLEGLAGFVGAENVELADGIALA